MPCFQRHFIRISMHFYAISMPLRGWCSRTSTAPKHFKRWIVTKMPSRSWRPWIEKEDVAKQLTRCLPAQKQLFCGSYDLRAIF